MLGFDLLEVFILIIIAIEGALLIQRKPEKEEDARATRRDVYGTFQNPLGDGYRKNKKGQYVPVRPNEKMIESSGGDE